MKSVVKPLSYVAMAISFTMSTLALAETAEAVKPAAAATPAPAVQPIVHHHKKQVPSDAKTAEAAVTDKAAVPDKTSAVTDKATATTNKTVASTQTTASKVVAAVPAEKTATTTEPAKAK
jgi:hypothetical protein